MTIRLGALFFICALGTCTTVGARQSSSGSSAFGETPPARQVARAADANRDGLISSSEWASLINSLDANQTGLVHSSELLVRATLPMIERLEDGVLTLEDLFHAFTEFDRNKDDALSARELAPRSFGSGSSRRSRGGSSIAMAVLSLRPADANLDGAVDPDEWGLFIDQLDLEPDGSIANHEVGRWIQNELAQEPSPRGFDSVSILRWVQSGLKSNEQGMTTVQLMQGFFERLDEDLDGNLSLEEMRFGRSGRARERAAANRAKPCLMPWQRSLEDALALVERSGKPLLICVNKDDEFASDSFAWSRYRDPAFVKLVEGFVPILVSTNRHDARDYDDRGRRIVGQRFGRLVASEHIDLERTLFKLYFDGTRAAPRHMGIAPDGTQLFDIYLDNDLSLVDKALKRHGKPCVDSSMPELSSFSLGDLLASPDALHRDELERRYMQGQAQLRTELAQLALSSMRRVQHPAIMRMALLDQIEAVRHAAVLALAQNPIQANLTLFELALRSSVGMGSESDALLAGLGKFVDSLADGALKIRAAALQRALLSLASQSKQFHWEQWGGWQTRAAEGHSTQAESDLSLVDQLSAAGAALALDIDDVEHNLAFAEAAMACIQVAPRVDRDAKLLLMDVIVCGRRAAEKAEGDGRGNAFCAWAEYQLGDQQAALDDAQRALQGLAPWGAGALAARMLSMYVELRVNTISAALDSEEAWPEAWLRDLQSALALYAQHPRLTPAVIGRAVALFNRLGVTGPQLKILRSALRRSPLSAALHRFLRAQIQRDGSAQGLEQAYESLGIADAEASARGYFEGLAWLEAAERHVDNRSTLSAQRAYKRSSELFAACRSLEPPLALMASQSDCLALAGLARLHIASKELALAQACLREATLANPEAVWKHDGLGNTPRETAQLLMEQLRKSSLDEEADGLRAFLAENGLEIGG